MYFGSGKFVFKCLLNSFNITSSFTLYNDITDKLVEFFGYYYGNDKESATIPNIFYSYFGLIKYPNPLN